jgi:ribosomal subunit interface protein
LSGFVYGKLAKLPRFAGDAVAADIVLRRHHGTAEGKHFSASARLALPGRDVHATVTHADLYTAISRLTKKLGRRSIKRKARRDRESKHHRHSARRRRSAMLRDALERWTEASAPGVEDSIVQVSETALAFGQTPGNTTRIPFGLVERSSSSNPAHGILSRHLERLAAYSRARFGAGDAFRRPARHTRDTL